MMAPTLSTDRDESAVHNGIRHPTGDAPYYVPTGDEVEIFSMCHARSLPVMLKGPTGCGKTRFVEHMAWRLQRPLVTIACHDDLSASDLTGRYLIRGGETVWVDGPLTVAARAGAICYLDEIVEAPSTRLLIATGRLIAGGIPAAQACRAAFVGPLTDDPDLVVAISDVINATL